MEASFLFIVFFLFNYHFSLKCGKSNLKFKKLCFIHCDNASDFSNIAYTAFFPDYIFLFLLSRKCFDFFIFKFLFSNSQQSYAVADAHFYLRCMPVYLFHMKIYVHTEKRCREMVENAVEFRR